MKGLDAQVFPFARVCDQFGTKLAWFNRTRATIKVSDKQIWVFYTREVGHCQPPGPPSISSLSAAPPCADSLHLEFMDPDRNRLHTIRWTDPVKFLN